MMNDINTATEITTAARRIARTSGKFALVSDKLVFDKDGTLIDQPYKTDAVRYDEIVVTQRITQREAQDILDSHAHARAARAEGVAGMYDRDVYQMARNSYMEDLDRARQDENR